MCVYVCMCVSVFIAIVHFLAGIAGEKIEVVMLNENNTSYVVYI